MRDLKQEKTFHEWETMGQPGALVTVKCRACGTKFDPAIRGQRESAESVACRGWA